LEGKPLSNDYVKSLDERMTRMESKLEEALRFKWLIVGISTGITSLFGVIITILTIVRM